eukprot:XP_001700600.1 predicted protein [Chlamydomonas reinhardtii]
MPVLNNRRNNPRTTVNYRSSAPGSHHGGSGAASPQRNRTERHAAPSLLSRAAAAIPNVPWQPGTGGWPAVDGSDADPGFSYGFEQDGALSPPMAVVVGPNGAASATPTTGRRVEEGAAGRLKRLELSAEEKEALFGRAGGIGALPAVIALGEGGEGLVDLVRVDLPAPAGSSRSKEDTAAAGSGSGSGMGRTLHLARKATRTFPFEVFDREVRAMKAALSALHGAGFVYRDLKLANVLACVFVCVGVHDGSDT